MATKTKLKPCPFCGGEVGLHNTGIGYIEARCHNATCGATIYGIGHDAAAAAWNSRASDPLPPAERRVVEAAVKAQARNSTASADKIIEARIKLDLAVSALLRLRERQTNAGKSRRKA